MDQGRRCRALDDAEEARAYKRQNRLDFALAEVGRIERTLFTLDWLKSPLQRRACQAGLNKGEARHALAQAVYAHRQGRFADRTLENQEHRASGRGRLVPTAKDIAPTQGGALKRAEALARRIPGATAICVVANAETGEVSAATILGTFGELPDDFAETLIEG